MGLEGWAASRVPVPAPEIGIAELRRTWMVDGHDRAGSSIIRSSE